jgi:hypothetical protein
MSNVAVSDAVRPAIQTVVRNLRANARVIAAFHPVRAETRLFHAWRP